MNEDQNMFAEMLGMKRQVSGAEPYLARSVDRPAVAAEDFVDELDVQKEVVEEMAREKVEIEERVNQLLAEKQQLEAENAKLADGKRALEAKLAACEDELSRLRAEYESGRANDPELAAVRAENAALEAKLVRMGRALMAARRAAAEAEKVEIAGRRW